MKENLLLDYLLQLGDNALVLGQRLAEWCGHGPILEQDMAITNISLDLFGQTRNIFQYAAKVEGEGRTEDDLAFLRDAIHFKNILLVELPNGDFGRTIVKQFLYDAFNFLNYTALLESTDKQLAAIAEKSLKEVTYHLRFSSEWMIRLGDGTDVSHQKMQTALNDLWMYTGELFEMSKTEKELLKTGVAVDLEKLKPAWNKKVKEICEEATLKIPEDTWMQTGGKTGVHTENLGFLLADMQYLQRAYPGQEW